MLSKSNILNLVTNIHSKILRNRNSPMYRSPKNAYLFKFSDKKLRCSNWGRGLLSGTQNSATKIGEI